MKKLIPFFLVTLFLLGSFPATFAEEVEMHEHEGCCEVHADGGIMPLVDCDHSGNKNREYIYNEQRGCKRTISYVRVTCAECGRFVANENVVYGTNDVHVGEMEIRLSQLPNGAVGYQAFCSACGELWNS